MASSAPSPSSAPLERGAYAPSIATDLRSPCPMINCLANHGFIPRDGRNVRASELRAAMGEVGLSSALGAVFSNPIFLERKEAGRDAPHHPRSIWARLWQMIRNPWALAFAAFGMRRPGQKDVMGIECLNLNQLALPEVVEHDISLTRYDYDHGRGDNLTIQPDLVRDLLAGSSDGGRTLSAEDLATLRRRRIEKQKEINPGLLYGPMQHQIACTEIALVLSVLGNGNSVPCDYARAFFLEERLPIREGWKKRRCWTLGFLELVRAVERIKATIGLQV